MLYIVSTPIGNLEDITLRALRILKEVDTIVCEDTRRAKILLNKYEINTPLLSYHSHSSDFKVDKILSLLKKGKDLALISDAGTPGISDPGYKIIQQATIENIPVSPIPGPSAFLTALQASGLPINRFLYLGFLPVKKGRKTLFESFENNECTIVFYESCHRILKTLNQLKEYIPHRNIVVARELTKVHEEFVQGMPEELEKHFQSHTCKGEFVIIISPNR